LHDGRVAIDLERNGTVVCRSLPKYGKLPGASPDVPDTILEMSWCRDPVRVRKGDSLVVKTHYDLDAHAERKAAGTEAGNATKPMGMGHGGHGGTPNKEAGMGHAMNGGMEGMEEMGIFTTNSAWDTPVAVKKNATNGFSFGSKGPENIDASKANTEAKKEASAGLYGEKPIGVATPQSLASPGSGSLPYSEVSPQTLGAQKDAAAKSQQDATNFASLVGGLIAAGALNALRNGGSSTTKAVAKDALPNSMPSTTGYGGWFGGSK